LKTLSSRQFYFHDQQCFYPVW